MRNAGNRSVLIYCIKPSIQRHENMAFIFFPPPSPAARAARDALRF